MPTQKFMAGDIVGFNPAIEPTQLDQKQIVLRGRNFTLDTIGPKSSFGSRLLDPTPMGLPQLVQGFELNLAVGDRAFYCFADAIQMWDEVAGTFRLIYEYQLDTLAAENGGPYRWTVGYLEGLFYFCHPSTGILVYDQTTGLMQKHTDIGVATPDTPIALSVNNGRLGVIDKVGFMSWSAPADGLNFAPALGSAGFQQISERVSGTPIMITSYANGFLTWTTGGVMRSEFTGDAAVFRHRSLSTDVRPVNSFCFIRVDDDMTVVLDERGLFQTKGDAPGAFSTLFNEFLIGYIRENGLTEAGNRLRLEYDRRGNQVFLSMSLAYASQGFDHCYVYYPPLQKWGLFSEFHYGIVPVTMKYQLGRSGNYFGYVDAKGRIYYWTKGLNREASPMAATHGSANLFKQCVDKPQQLSALGDKTIVSTTFKAAGFNIGPISAQGRSAFYGQLGTAPIVPAVTGLNAMIQVGVFRPTGSDAVDDLSEVLGVQIRSQLSRPVDIEIEDLELESDAVDLADETGVDDLGTDVPDYINHKLRIIGSLDGTTEWLSVTPVEVSFAAGARNYACSVKGIWHIIEVSATDIGESFHLKGGELTAASAGRLK